MSTTLKEWLVKTIAELSEERDAVPGAVNEDAANALAAMKLALASFEAEPGVNHQPVAWQYKEYVHVRGLGYLWRERLDCEFPGADCETLQDVVPLYIAPPAPVSVPDERYQHLSELYHAQEKRLFKLAQRIKGPAFDKYAHSPSQAIDVLESALFVESDDDGRSALLQEISNEQ
ncbi:Uncharacterised protein [Enterobacter hormaechei]|uniref:hypothetical protein n=1 Tax=Enterobacter hormaechei TaxID=158836 RepID=UPI000795A768|nr:hypothetical protein [Enterobacter hormaechei]CZZ81462.1 Uncharacterised protein [Enterobacter hormaechei]SAG22632.1 Uncharacterised protein [Enterobacter hormaechei]